MPQPIGPQDIAAAHRLYGQLTGQSLRLGFDRERQWYEWLRAGFTLEDLRRVVRYLQREIRAGRRNVGALKLSNLLQLDRFEEDLNIRRVRLEPPPPPPAPPSAPLSQLQRETQRLYCLEQIRRLKTTLHPLPTPPSQPSSTDQSSNPAASITDHS